MLFPTVDLFMWEEVRDLMGKNVKFYTKPLWKTDIRRWKGWDSRGRWPTLGPVRVDVPWQLLSRLRLLTWSGLSSPSTFMCPPPPCHHPSLFTPPSPAPFSFPLHSLLCWPFIPSGPFTFLLRRAGFLPRQHLLISDTVWAVSPLLPVGDFEQMVGWRVVRNLTHGEKPTLILKSVAGLQSECHSLPAQDNHL